MQTKLIKMLIICSRCIYYATVWYYNHLAGLMPVVMVTEDAEAIQKYGSETDGVFVVSFKVINSPMT